MLSVGYISELRDTVVMSDILRFNFVYQEKSRSLQVAAERNTGKLTVQCHGFFGQEDTVPDYNWDFVQDEGDWEKLIYAIEDNKADKWEASYIDESVENGVEWSLEIHTLGKHTMSEGYNRFPKEFEAFKEDILSFVRMKRRQIVPAIEGFNFLAVAELKGLTNPIVFVDKLQKTFTFYNLLDDIENDGTYFMEEGDWENIQEIVLDNAIFDKFKGFPTVDGSRKDFQFSVSVGYGPGQITQRFRGDEPEWWDNFATAVYNYVTMIYTEGRKPADGNIGAYKE